MVAWTQHPQGTPPEGMVWLPEVRSPSKKERVWTSLKSRAHLELAGLQGPLGCFRFSRGWRCKLGWYKQGKEEEILASFVSICGCWCARVLELLPNSKHQANLRERCVPKRQVWGLRQALGLGVNQLTSQSSLQLSFTFSHILYWKCWRFP